MGKDFKLFYVGNTILDSTRLQLLKDAPRLTTVLLRTRQTMQQNDVLMFYSDGERVFSGGAAGVVIQVL